MHELVGDETRRLEIELHRMIDPGDLMEVVEEPAAGTAPEDEPLDEARAQKHDGKERQASGSHGRVPLKRVCVCHRDLGEWRVTWNLG